MPPWVLITPSSRGIGLTLARRLLRQTTLPIVATTRTDTPSTTEAILSRQQPTQASEPEGVPPTQPSVAEAPRDSESRLTVLQLDVTNEESIAAAAETCRQRFPAKEEGHLHLACCVPGLLRAEKAPAQLELGAVRAQFDTNVIGPMLVLKHFSAFLPRKQTTSAPLAADLRVPGVLGPRATWVNMSARVGSIADNGLGGWYSYRASKAAVNQVTKTFDNYLRATSGENAMAMGYHPGTVKTDFTREYWGSVKKEKLFSVDLAAEKMLEVVATREGEHRGACWDWKGEVVPP